MLKFTKLTFIAFLLATTISCEKDYVCDCTYDDASLIGSDNTTESYELKSKTKEDATSICEDQEDHLQETEDSGARCTLKRQ